MRRAFTSIEALMTIGIIAVTAGVSVPLYRNAFLDAELDRTKDQIVKALQTAQINAQAGRGQWGVHIPSGTLYRGETYEERDTGTEVVMAEIPPTVALNGLSDVSFLAVSGQPSTEGDIYGSASIGHQWIITIRKRGIFATANSEDLSPPQEPMGSSSSAVSSSQSTSSLVTTTPSVISCPEGTSFMARSVTRLDSSFATQAVGAGQQGLTFDTAQATITVGPSDSVYLMGYDPTVSPVPAQHFTDDQLILSTSVGVHTRTIDYSGESCEPTRQSSPVNITNLFLTGGETAAVTAPVSAAFQDRCGGLISHTAYYLTVGACGELDDLPGTESSSSSSSTSSASSDSSQSSSSDSSSSGTSSSSDSSASSDASTSSSSSTSDNSSSDEGSSSSSSSDGGDDYSDTCEDRFVLGADGAIRLTGRGSVKVYTLGSRLKYNGTDVPVKVSYSLNDGATWYPLFGGAKLQDKNDGSQRDEGSLQNLAAGTRIIFRVQGSNGTTYSRTQTTTDGTSRVRLFRRGDRVPTVASLANDALPEYLRDYVKDGMSKASRYDLLLLSYLNDVSASNADYLHASLVIHVDQETDACSGSSSSTSSSTSSDASVKAPRVKFVFERVENIGKGNLDRSVFIGPQAIERGENEWITLVEDNGTPRNDVGMVEDVPGVAIERQGAARILHIVEHGTLSTGKEIMNLRVIFDGATIVSVTGDADQNKPEGLTDGVITDGPGGDEVVVAGDQKSAVIYSRVTSADDGFLIHWMESASSSSSSADSSAGSNSSAGSSASTSSSSSSSSSDEPKVTICHVVGSGTQNLEVPQSALSGHLGHGDKLGSCTGDEDEDGIMNQDDLCPETTLDRQFLYWDDRLGVVLKGKSYRQGKRLTISRYTLEDTQGCSCTQLLNVAAGTNSYYVTNGNPDLYLLLQSLPNYYITAAKSFGCAKGFLDNVSR